MACKQISCSAYIRTRAIRAFAADPMAGVGMPGNSQPPGIHVYHLLERGETDAAAMQ